MKLYRLKEEDRQFLFTLLYATGIILFWRGVWEITYELPIVKNPYVVFFIGLLILTMTGYMYREYDLFSQRARSVAKVLHAAIDLAKKGEKHTIYYYDDIGGHEHQIKPENIKKIEHDLMVVSEKGHELFIPLHRIRRVHKGREILWKR